LNGTLFYHFTLRNYTPFSSTVVKVMTIDLLVHHSQPS